MALTVEAAGRTDVGLVRRRNEDSLYTGRYLFAVADGLGGHVAGDIASSTVIEALKPYDRPFAESDLSNALGQAVRDANTALGERIRAEPGVTGMGTTLVAMLWSGSKYVLANVGDSRAYVIHDGAPRCLTPLTEDHIYGNLMSDAADVPNLPPRLARFLDGRADGRSPDLTVRNLRADDRFLLCSDGLSPVVPDDLIQATLSTPGAPDETAEHLVQQAIDHSGPDNVTVIVADCRNHSGDG
ncbi:hypothetical protein Acsp03_37800 [Actinomadura sp. NBRC 104412]|uniref:PP2C family protein-serine/threonine phosphatase n=1 Tax=Actinomadura sp. NBRC 104412 TaxID=3032203 RepID=UPI0024A609B7|nr:protein phosphatase 2C domain-containing protein [Actinomadura sp. NBRC 104412]GLZ06314.1 hypothetical protein Acsp03_37800 [Actinomadura sp. NBRC 104412]